LLGQGDGEDANGGIWGIKTRPKLEEVTGAAAMVEKAAVGVDDEWKGAWEPLSDKPNEHSLASL